MILLVDDHEDSLYALSRMLESHGHQVATATSGEQALKLLESVRPHVIVLDMMLPGMSGLETLAAIRRTGGLERIPVILCSAGVTDREVERAMILGVEAYLLKVTELWEQLPDMVQRFSRPAPMPPPGDHVVHAQPHPN